MLSITILTGLIYLGQHILIPILLSLLIAILLRPVVSFLSSKLLFPHVIAVLTSVIFAVLIVTGVIVFVSFQVKEITDDWGHIQTNLDIHYHNIQRWVSNRFDISYSEQEKYIREVTKESLPGSNETMGNTLSSFGGFFFNCIVIPFYTFLILLYRNLFIKFLSKLFKEEHQHTLKEILFEIKYAVRGFLVGLMIEMLIVSSLTSIGLMIVGVPFAVLLGVITGILNIIPYIGILFAALLSIVATLTGTADISLVIGVLVVNGIVQLIDNNILVPMIVSSKVKINALVSIIGIVIGGVIAGIAGMFLAIPMIAVLKVIFDRIEPLEPWGFLMGDDLPKTFEWKKLKLPAFDAGSSTDTRDSINIIYRNSEIEDNPD